MADPNAHVTRHMTAARDHMSGIVRRREALEALVAAGQAERAQQPAHELSSQPVDPPDKPG